MDVPHRPATGDDPWAVRFHPAPGAALRLFCLPHSGAGAAVYRTWASLLAPQIEVVAVRLPGRETRRREEPARDLGELLPRMVDALTPWLDRPHAWFGHSLGALLAFEAGRLLSARGHAPTRVLVSGRRAPDSAPREDPVHAAPLPALLTYLRGLGGTVGEVLDDPAMVAWLEPALRADLAMAENYEPVANRGPLHCPMSVFGGEDDRLTTAEELQAWAATTQGPCLVRRMSGGHFFLHEPPERLVPYLRRDLLGGGVPGAGPAAAASPAPQASPAPTPTPTAGKAADADALAAARTGSARTVGSPR